jgi:hypothetical protein
LVANVDGARGYVVIGEEEVCRTDVEVLIIRKTLRLRSMGHTTRDLNSDDY